MICMKMKIVDRAEKKAVSARNGTKTIRKWPVLLLLLLLPVTFGLSGCEDEYYAGARPGYGPYYGGNGPYGPGYAGYPGYGPYPGSVTVEIGDRPYYSRGPGYYVGRSYYVWRPGHCVWNLKVRWPTFRTLRTDFAPFSTRHHFLALI